VRICLGSMSFINGSNEHFRHWFFLTPTAVLNKGTRWRRRTDVRNNAKPIFIVSSRNLIRSWVWSPPCTARNCSSVVMSEKSNPAFFDTYFRSNDCWKLQAKKTGEKKEIPFSLLLNTLYSVVQTHTTVASLIATESLFHSVLQNLSIPNKL
jgi:hypothetical protein